MNKLQIKEQEWWDKLGPDKQAAYIQAHPGSQKAQDATEKEEPEEEPSGEPEGGEKKPIPAKDLANDPNADTGPDSRGIAWSGDYSGAEDSAEWEEQYRETEEWAAKYPEDAEKLAQIKWFGEKQGWGDRGELSSSARTGNELNQETLTIDGKQYRRINESVKQKPKSKYKFSEFYKRFKR